MTFEQFQASGRDVKSLAEALPDQSLDYDFAGRVYLDRLHIVSTLDWGTYLEDPSIGRWYLVIGNREWQTDDLESLERRLYAFAVDEGLCG